ncbi:MAG: type II toxin-antitoxin system VapC family toxin [Cytophagales bacterium]
MNIFLDTSSLFKLYHREIGTEQLLDLFTTSTIDKIFLSEISVVEFDSVVWKKFRKGEIDEFTVLKTIANFSNDLPKFDFIKDNQNLKKSARQLLTSYGKLGLRSLDSLQLASALMVKEKAALFITADKLLEDFFIKENLKILSQQ